MMKKKLIALMAAGMICSGFSTVFDANTVEATPKVSSEYWWKTRKVRVTKNTKIYKIPYKTPSYKARPVKSHILKKGTVVKLQGAGSDWTWFFMGYIPGVGKAYKHYQYSWVCNKYNTKWFKVIK